MVKVGDRIRLSSGKGPDREGVVTALTGSMVRVRWPSGDETMVIPAPGTLTVLAAATKRTPVPKRERAAPRRVPPKKTAAKKPAAKKTSSDRATSKQMATTKKAAPKHATTSTSGARKTDTKRSSR